MPELPEVETVKRSLCQLVLNKEINEVIVNYDRIVQSDLVMFKKNLIGQEIKDITRVGKYLVFRLTDYILLSHLRMEGKYFLKSKTDELSKHDHIIFKFTDSTELRYNDTRKFGVMYLFNTTSLEEVKSYPPLNKLGLEPGNKNLNINYLKEKFSKVNLPIKSALLDQTIISGLGNIYADEVLFKSKINPYEKASSLDNDKLNKIISSSEDVITKAINLGGTTIKSFVNSHAATGLFQNELLVHTKEVCPECGEKITKEFIGGRGSYYCKKCQKKEKTIVAITGSIATGKSTVSNYLKELGFKVIDLDKIAHTIYDSKELVKKIDINFPGVVNSGIVDRKLLGTLIFSSNEKKELLNKLTHPVIMKKMNDEISLTNDKIIFVDIPLLFEGGFEKHFDYIMLSYVDKDIQLERLILRDNISKEYAIKKIASQIDIEKKKSLSDFVVDNSSSIEYTKVQVKEIINILRGV